MRSQSQLRNDKIIMMTNRCLRVSQLSRCLKKAFILKDTVEFQNEIQSAFCYDVNFLWTIVLLILKIVSAGCPKKSIAVSSTIEQRSFA